MSITLHPSTALKLLLDVNKALVVSGEPDLSFRQLSVLLALYLAPPPFSVTLLASQLKVSKPVITRALNHLGTLGLIERERNKKDKRLLTISRTAQGALFLERLANHFIEKGANLPLPPVAFVQLNRLDEGDLESLLRENSR